MAISGVNGGAIPLSPNYITNSAFDHWQRLPIGSTSFTANAAYIFTADRWVILSNNTGGSVIVSKENFTPGELVVPGAEGASYIRNSAVSPTGATYNVYQHKIEDVRTLAGQTATLSFYARANKSVTILSQFFQAFGTGGSGEVYAGISPSHDLTTSWQRYTATFIIPSISGKTVGAGSSLRLEFKLPENQSQVVDIWGVQVEAGNFATPYRRNASNAQAELAICQKFYHRISSDNVYQAFGNAIWEGGSSLFLLFVNHPVTMRSTPTVEWAGPMMVYNGSGSYTVTAIAASAFMSKTRSRLNITAGTGSASVSYELLSANSSIPYIGFSAELP